MENTDNQFDKKDNQNIGEGNSEKIKIDLKKGFHNVFLDELKDIYFSEKALLLTIPVMIKNADSEVLTEAMIKRLEFTQKHIIRLEEIFYSLGESEMILNQKPL
ncbi:MAG: DUF892 family protein [Flavobacterium sp.]